MGRNGDDARGRTGEWRFLVDENLDPALATILNQHGFAADHVLDALFEGAGDSEDVLPYCREIEAILVTNDYSDFNEATLSPRDHAGVIIVYDKDRPPEEIATEIRRIAEAYGDRDSFRGFDNADDWSERND